jgi:hypothetical protein
MFGDGKGHITKLDLVLQRILEAGLRVNTVISFFGMMPFNTLAIG